MDQEVLEELKTYLITFVKLLSSKLEEKNKPHRQKHGKNIVSPLDSRTILDCWKIFLVDVEDRFGPNPVLGEGLDVWWVYCFLGLTLHDKSIENDVLGVYSEREWFLAFINVIKRLIELQNGKPFDEPNFDSTLWGFFHGLGLGSKSNRSKDIGIRTYCLYHNIVRRLDKL